MNSQSFRDSALEIIDDAVIAIDPAYEIVYWNRGAEQLYGTSKSEALGKKLNEIYEYQWLNPTDEAHATQILMETGSFRGTYKHITLTKKELIVEATTSLIQKDGEILGMLAIIRDRTESHRMTLALQETIEKLKEETKHRQTLEEMIIVCAWSGLVKNGEEWVRMEEFLMKRFGLKISHGMSPDVMKREFEAFRKSNNNKPESL